MKLVKILGSTLLLLSQTSFAAHATSPVEALQEACCCVVLGAQAISIAPTNLAHGVLQTTLGRT